MDNPNVRHIYAKALGDLVVSYLEVLGCSPVPDVVESRALDTLARVKAVLDNNALDDPDCFHRIEAIVEVFYSSGLSTSRHDFG